MGKNIIVLSDGTWNEGAESETNIHWLNQNLINQPGRQHVHYDAGVGTKWFNDTSGGALGVGLSRNVRQLYEKVWADYEPGDDVYCFGFSRGAFTVRSLCGFMNLVGRVGSADEIDEAYTYYRVHESDDDDNAFEELFKPTSKGLIAVRFLGVFDTVGSLGLPIEIDDDNTALRDSFLGKARAKVLSWFDGLGDRLRRPIKGFHDTRLGGNVEEAYHALAIDERRQSFAPTLWTDAQDNATKLRKNGEAFDIEQRVEQMWFAGAHSDVGGGYKDVPFSARISNLPLLWIAQKAEAAGLLFRDGFIDGLLENAPFLAKAPHHDSLTDRWHRLHKIAGKPALMRPIGNDARREDNPSGDRFPVVSTPEWIDMSIGKRLFTNVEVRHGDDAKELKRVDYEPQNVVPVQSMIRQGAGV